jgi:ribulose-phosphate 3-epimerase
MDEIDTLIVMTVNPGWAGQAFIAEMLPKIREAREHIDRHALNVDIAVDGGVNLETGRQALEAGANVLGAASSIFNAPDSAAAARALRDLLDSWAIK